MDSDDSKTSTETKGRMERPRQHRHTGPRQSPPQHGTDSPNAFAGLANQINKLAGVDTPSELKLSDVFSDVFKKHTEEDAERLFYVGTSQTTPPIESIADTWPKPWFFARVFAVVGVCYILLYIGCIYFTDFTLLPGLIMTGSFIVPLSVLVFFWEMNAPQNVAIYKIITMAFVGGVLSLLIAVFLESESGMTSAIIAGVAEEAAKALAIMWFLRTNRYKYILNGLLIGAAIGAGFSAFETAGYVLNGALNGGLQMMYSTIFWRGVLAPGSHIAWGALSGAALCMVLSNKEFSWSIVKDGRFIRIWVIAVVLHIIWDLPIYTGSIPFVQIVLTLISWVIAFGMMNAGLKQISKLKNPI